MKQWFKYRITWSDGFVMPFTSTQHPYELFTVKTFDGTYPVVIERLDDNI